jgi:PAS domain S-box-containing protein
MNPSLQPSKLSPSVLRALSPFSGEFIAIWDEKGQKLIHFNEAYKHIFGFQDEASFQARAAFFSFRKNPLDEELVTLIMDTIHKNGHWSEEVLFRRQHNDFFLGRLDVSKFEEGGNVYLLQRVINIDTQRIFSENLFREIKKFEALFQYATLPILLVDKSGTIILANQQAMDLFDYGSSVITTLKVEDLIPPRYRDKHISHRNGYDKRPENRPMGRGMQLMAIKKDGTEFPVEVSLGHYTIEHEPYVIAFIIDISKRVETENTLRSQKEEVEKANREIEELNAELEHKVEVRTHELTEALSRERELSDLKSRFVSMASHEFRTPLSTILSSISLIGKYTGSDEQDKRDKHILRIRSAVSNLTDILNEFLSLGKIEEGKIQVHLSEFNLKEQMNLIISEIQPILKTEQTIQYEHNGHDHANLDVSLVRNIMINLISNAIKFSPEKATIWVLSENKDNKITISVKDEGLGIAEDDKKHLFERFFRGKNVVNIQGTGLGLHIVSRYIDFMGGSIEVQSELEKGTAFTLNFNI